MTVMEPPGFSTSFSFSSAAAGFGRCSSTKQTNTWSKLSGANGRLKMSARWKVTFVKPASPTRFFAAASDSSEISIEVMRASRAVLRENDRLRPHPAARFQHGAPGG